MDDLDLLLSRVKQAAHGLMPLAVYRRLYETAAACGGDTLVEVGTFRGAATIALALGAKSAGRPFNLVTADLLRPGVGARGDSVAAKTAELEATFARFGVADAIRFVPGTSAALLAAADPTAIALLLLDGGGKLEADLDLLWDRLSPGCTIVIDDIDGRVFVDAGLRMALIDQKHRISKLLADRFVEAGLLVPVETLQSTGWYRKGAAEVEPGTFARLALPAYHELIKVPVPRREFGSARSALRHLAARMPGLARAYRRLRPGG
jgi:predicted O-methyltransferase YrrM